MTRVVRSSREEKRRERERDAPGGGRDAREGESHRRRRRSFVRSRVDMTTDRTVMKTVEGVSPMDIDLMANTCLSYGDARHLHTLYV